MFGIGSVLAESRILPAAPPGLVETGAPSFNVFGPDTFGLSATPSDIHVMPDGRIVAVSRLEIAIGDGFRWKVFRADEGVSPIFSHIAVDDQGQIYAGVEGGVARVDFTENARWKFTSVMRLPGDTNIQQSTPVSVHMHDNWYWYGGASAITAWKPGADPRLVLTGGPPTEMIATLGRDIFVSEGSTGGMYRVTDGTAELVASTGSSVSNTVTAATQFAPGELLVGTLFSGLKVFDGRTFRPLPVQDALFEGNRINDLCPITADIFAAAVDTVGVVFFDRSGKPLQTLERSLDHRLGRPQRLRYSREGVLWALLNDGVARVDFPSPLSHFAPLLASGLTYATPLRYDGRLWVLATGRAMRGVYTASGRLERFVEDTPPGNFLFTLCSVDGQLFASNDTGTFVYEDAQWEFAFPGLINARIGVGRTTAEGIPYVARGEFGFIRRTSGGYSLKRTPVPGLADNYNAIQDRAGVVWIELGIDKVGRFTPNDAAPAFSILSTGHGLTSGWPEAYLIDGIARIHLPNHVFRFDDAQRRFVDDTELLSRFPQLQAAFGRPIADISGRIWYTAAGAAHRLEKDPVTGVYRGVEFAGGFAPTEYTLEENKVMWLFQPRRLSRVDLRAPAQAIPLPKALIASVEFTGTGRHRFNPGEKLGTLDYTDNSLVFHFMAPANPFRSTTSFEVMLEGAGSKWVSTGTVGSAAFTRLKEGRYRFRVRPVTNNNQPGIEAHVEFAIRPPWFRTPFAWTLYVVGGLGFIALAGWLPVYLQRRENTRLEQLVASRTCELNEMNRQLGRQIEETTEKSTALSASEERYRALNADLEHRVAERTAQLSHSNEELRQRESLFRLIFEHAPVGIAWKRTDLGDAYHFNPTFSRILELHTDIAADYSVLASLVHTEDVPRQQEMNRRIGTGELDNYNIEQRFVLRSGRLVWGSLSVAVVRDSDGRIVQDISILEDITARKQAEHELANTYKDLVAASRMAGMAEVATGVLHNVGNVLNSLNVSSTVIGTKARTSQVEKFGKLAALLHEHSGDLAGFLTQDPKGRLLPDYIAMLAKRALEERAWLVAEIASMQKNIDHIKEIVAMQQGYARVAGVTEMIEAETLFEDALQINSTALSGHDVKVIREYAPVPLLCVEKGKILQILINLIRNAMFACDEARKLSAGEKNLVVRVEPGAKGNTVKLIVRDNGVGIPQENMLRIFRHGFTTRANGHGFGLHASALAAKEMRGSLAAQSEGAGKGATFTLELPIAPVSALHVPDSPPDPHGVSDPMRHSRATGSRPAFAEHT